MIGEDRFCPKCGAQRQPGMSFCGRCGYGFPAGLTVESSRGIGGATRSSDVRPPNPGWEVRGGPPPEPPRAEGTVAQVAIFAGVAWILAAAVLGYLAYLQWELGSTLKAAGMADQGLTGTALWNVVSAGLTAYFGARCILGSSKGTMTTSAVWAVLNVGWGVYQLATNGGSAIFALVVVLTAVAGILSWAARSAMDPGPQEPWRP